MCVHASAGDRAEHGRLQGEQRVCGGAAVVRGARGAVAAACARGAGAPWPRVHTQGRVRGERHAPGDVQGRSGVLAVLSCD